MGSLYSGVISESSTIVNYLYSQQILDAASGR